MIDVTLGNGYSPAGVVLNRILALRSIVGEACIANIRTPFMRGYGARMRVGRPATIRDYPDLAHLQHQTRRQRAA